MKLYYFLAIISIILASCDANNETSDAYGNFEATEVTVSALGQGQIMQFDLDEGSVLEKGQQIGLIDTIDLHLQLEQLINFDLSKWRREDAAG